MTIYRNDNKMRKEQTSDWLDGFAKYWKEAEGPFVVQQGMGILGNWCIYLKVENGDRMYVTAFARDKKITAEDLCARLNQLWK